MYNKSVFNMPLRLAGKIIDIDANFCHPDLCGQMQYHLDNAVKRNVAVFVVPGSTLADSVKSIELARSDPSLFISTAGVHPYNTESIPYTETSKQELESLFDVPEESTVLLSEDHRANTLAARVRCVGECGLDYSEGFPLANHQLPWFKFQVALAMKHDLPLYLHIRNAHDDFVAVMKELCYLRDDRSTRPGDNNTSNSGNATGMVDVIKRKAVVHCFTGSYEELCLYLDMGFYIGLTGYILNYSPPCSLVVDTETGVETKANTGQEDGMTNDKDLIMRQWLLRITLDRLMIETDAPYMGFKGCRETENIDSEVNGILLKNSLKKKNLTQKYPNVPSSIVKIIQYISKVTDWSEDDIIYHTTKNAVEFFRIE